MRERSSKKRSINTYPSDLCSSPTTAIQRRVVNIFAARTEEFNAPISGLVRQADSKQVIIVTVYARTCAECALLKLLKLQRKQAAREEP